MQVFWQDRCYEDTRYHCLARISFDKEDAGYGADLSHERERQMFFTRSANYGELMSSAVEVTLEDIERIEEHMILRYLIESAAYHR